jgi:hypothetical protein
VPVSLPESWASLTRTTVDLGDILGVPGMRRRAVMDRAATAFDAPARSIGPPSSLLVMARRSRPAAGAGRTGAEPSRAADVVEAVLADATPRAAGAGLRRVHTLTSATGEHRVLQQQVRGHDVVGGRVLVHVDAAGPYGLSGHPVVDLGRRDPGPLPDVPARRVRAAVRRLFPVEPRARLAVRPVVLPTEGTARWAWFVKVPVAEPMADVRVFLDEQLTPLLTYPASVPALPGGASSGQARLGEAMAFRGNPLRSADPERVCLRDLDDPAGGLSGPRVAVSTALGSALRSPERDFVLAPEHPGFDEAAAFHHGSDALRYYRSLFRPELFDQPLFSPLRLVVHHDRSINNAYFHPDRGTITFGDFVAGPMSARSADVVLHEVGHAVIHAVSRLSDTPAPQALGLGEGYSDYFACSALDDPRFGDYITQHPAGARSCTKRVHLAGNLDTVGRYVLGEAWAGALWEIREELGPPVADALAAESLYFAPTVTGVAEATAALHAADAVLFPARRSGTGRHAATIDTAVTRRFDV